MAKHAIEETIMLIWHFNPLRLVLSQFRIVPNQQIAHTLKTVTVEF